VEAKHAEYSTAEKRFGIQNNPMMIVLAKSKTELMMENNISLV